MHSFTKLWVHAVWSTRDRKSLISGKIEPVLHEFLKNQFNQLDCKAKIINGMPDHVHCLFDLNRERALADVIKQVKGSSSHFINASGLLEDKFAWQTGYAAFSVSEPGSEVVAAYIKNQKLHHEQKTFQEEYALFLKIHGFTYAA